MSDPAPDPASGPLVQEIIAAKRDGLALARCQIERFVGAIADGSASEGQVAAFAMAVYLRGMDRAETLALTDALMASGAVLDWSGLATGRPVIDKHSTGGVGDTVSLILAPALAAAGALVPMIAGRGLGHTGGTVDKLAAIPGYATQPDRATFMALAARIGLAIVSQTGELAPADRRLYAIRDVTATVESVPLITASILAKKRAAGLDALVLDVKTGSGAFTATPSKTDELAASLVEVGGTAGLKIAVLVTDMDEPLANVAGNAIEVAHAIDILAGRRHDDRLERVTGALGGRLLALCGLASDAARGEAMIYAAIADGRAAELFAAMVAALGGPADLIERPAAHLPAAPICAPCPAPRGGYVGAIDTRAIGWAVVELGGGRRRAEDTVDPAVGLSQIAPVGAHRARGEPLCLVHARSAQGFQTACRRIASAYRMQGEPPTPRDLVLGRLEATR